MTTKEFAKYVIDNMGRATLANALNIGTKLDNPEYYPLNDFLAETSDYLGTAVSLGKIDTITSYKIAVAIDKCQKKITSTMKYNKMMIIDTLVMDIWEAVNGK